MIVRMEVWLIFITLYFIQGWAITQNRVTLHVSNTNTLEHSNVTLTCVYTGSKSVDTSKWSIGTKNGFVVRSGSTCIGLTPFNNPALYRVNCPSSNSFAVTMLNVTRKNHGEHFQCSIKNIQEKSNDIILNVTVPVKEVTLTGIKQVQENSTVIYNCNASVSLPPPNIFWFKHNNGTTTEIKNQGSFVVITRRENEKDGNLVQVTEKLRYVVNRFMNGWSIYCNGSNWMDSQVKSNEFTLNVTYPPDGPPVIHGFNNGSTYKIIETKPANLSCSVEGGNPLGKPKLYCKDVFTDTLKEIISIDNKKVTTNLSWIASRHQGNTCTCKTDNIFSTDLVYVNIDVLYSTAVLALQLRDRNYFTQTVTSAVQLIENKPYWLSCGADGNPLPTTFNWTGPQGMQTSNNNTIHLSDVLRAQSGTYTCQAQNIMTPTYGANISGKNNISVDIEVLYRPNIMLLDKHDVIEGNSFNITCKAISANPNKTHVIWTRDKHDWNNTSHVLKLLNITRHDSMNYTCTMKNNMTPTVGREEEGSDSETFYLNVWYKAAVKEFVVKGHEMENPVIANQSTSIQFTCEMDSNPNSTGSINSPNGTTLGVSNTKYLLSSCLDSGIYSCSGSNDYNYGQQAGADINLLVNCKPMSHERVQEDIRSELYVPVTLQFTAIAYPVPEFTWEVWTNSSWEEITNNDMIYITSLGMQSNLTVNNFTSTEVNYFRLIIKNFIGDLTQNYTLQPFDRPNPPMELYSIQELLTDTSITLTWRPGFNGGTPQNFSIQYKSEKSQNLVSLVLQDTGEAMMKLKIDRLISTTNYEFEIVAMNIKGNSTALLLRVKTKDSFETTEDSIVGLVAGSISGAIAFAGLVVFGILLYRKRFLHIVEKRDETGKLIYQNVPFSAKTPNKSPSTKMPRKEETSFHGLQELDDDPPLYREPTEYYNSIEKIEQIERIRVSELLAYVSNRSEEAFGIDYQKLPTGLQKPCTFARRRENLPMNRYNGIYPYDHSRVKISGQPNFFINACYIDGYDKTNAYIASLGPTGKTTYDFKTFWMMVWNEQSDIIVMLTNLTEPSGMKCEQYWPDLGENISYGDIHVLCEREEVFAEYTTRSLTLSNANNQRRITHLHYTAWPDKKVPEDVTTLVEFRQRLKATRSSKNGPVIVHCSAGIGRTGTLIALDRLTQEGQCEFSVDIFKCVNSMREQRVKMVQTQEQYIYIYKALVNSLYFDSETIPFESFQEYVQETNNNIYSKQFQQLKESVETSSKEESDARSRNETLVNKNRYGADIPGSQYRVNLYLNRQMDMFDYINAVYVNSLKKKDHFIIAQTPLPGTVSDFICMIYQEECCCVVTMEDMKEPGMIVGQFLPSDGRTLKCGELKISCTLLETKPQYIVREMRIGNSKNHQNSEKVVYHFQYKNWIPGNDTPADAREFVQFVKDVEDYADQLGEETSHVLVHCLKANERSALYCVVSILMEKMRYERQASVLNTVRHLRTRRRSAITSMEQLKFCYQTVSAYINMPKS